MGNQSESGKTRRRALQLLGGTVGTTLACTRTGVASADAGESTLADHQTVGAQQQTGETPTPSTGRLTGGSATGGPQTAAVHDLGQHTEAEYRLSGTARVLAEPEAFGDREVEIPDGPAEYATRMLVYRPASADDFSGDVFVEWLNVTLQQDVPVAWINLHEYLLREGWAVVLVSAQTVGVDDSLLQDLVEWDPDRYGDLFHPGDAYSFDIFSQAIQSLRDAAGPAPLDGLVPERIFAGGASQSAAFLHTYITEVQPDAGLVDGFLPSKANVRDEAVTETETPVLQLNSEDEAPSTAPDTETFRLWAVAGASHANAYFLAWFDVMRGRDVGATSGQLLDEERIGAWNPAFAGQYGQLADAPYGDCGTNYFPVRYAYRSALDQLRAWVQTGEQPPTVPRIEFEDGDPVVDEFDNAVGGLRLPPIETPLATYLARDEVCGGGITGLQGATERFDTDQFEREYDSGDAYLAAIERSADEAVETGVLLDADRTDLLARAETVEPVYTPGESTEGNSEDDGNESQNGGANGTDSESETGSGDDNGSENDSTDGNDSENDSADGSGPGFGAGVALVGVGGAGYLVRRQRDDRQ
jgi:PGF-CTERM protein